MKEFIGIVLFVTGIVLVAITFFVEMEGITPPVMFFSGIISVITSIFLTKKYRGYILGLLEAYFSSDIF